MNVLHVISSLEQSGGGPIVALRGLAHAQSNLGVNVRVLSTCRSNVPSMAHVLEQAGCRVILLPYQTRASGQILRWTRTIFQHVREADVVHIHGLWQVLPTIAAMAAREGRIPYVVRSCGMLDSWSMAQKRAIKQLHLTTVTRPLMNAAAFIHATTTREQNEIARFNFKARTEVVANGVDDAAFDEPPDSRKTLELEGLRARHRIILFLGRVHPKKGLDVLLPAMGRVRTPNALLAIYGPKDDSYHGHILHEIENLGISDRVRFFDPVYGDARFSVYACSSLFILPSKQENFGISVAEAMACGTPTVVSPEVALADLIEATACGRVVRRSPTLLAQAVDQVLADDALRALMSRRGRAVAEQHFRWKTIAARWQELYGVARGLPAV